MPQRRTSVDFFTGALSPIINPGEYMVIRPSRLLAFRVEPILSSSIERYLQVRDG